MPLPQIPNNEESTADVLTSVIGFSLPLFQHSGDR
jgi:hypothetical protein